MKKILLYLLSLKHKLSLCVKDFNNRKYILLVQYFFIRKKKNTELLKRYTISDFQKKEIDSFYSKYYGKSISSKWHNYLASYNSVFNVKYIPMSIYYGEVEYFMNPYKDYVRVFENKSVICKIARSNGIKTPVALFTCTCGQLFDEQYSPVSFHEVVVALSKSGSFFVKPTVDSCSGSGCSMHQIDENGKDIFTGKSVEQILRCLGGNYAVQRVLKNHKTISSIYDKSLNTLRVITYQWKGRIYHVPVIMRMGRNGSRVDNACAGGIYIGVDIDGCLHNQAYSLKGEILKVHPDSKIVFAKHRILPLDETISAAVQMHRSLPMLGIVNWDFAIDELGDPVLIEANIAGGGGSWMCQIAHGQGLFGERTEEILQWLKLMKSLPVYNREKYYFGKNVD